MSRRRDTRQDDDAEESPPHNRRMTGLQVVGVICLLVTLALGGIVLAGHLIVQDQGQGQRPEDVTPSADQLSAKVVAVRINFWTEDGGVRMRCACVDWKNTGTKPIRCVFAKLVIRDEDGNLLISESKEYCIYANIKPIMPGKVYEPYRADGCTLGPDRSSRAATATATITRVYETDDPAEQQKR